MGQFARPTGPYLMPLLPGEAEWHLRGDEAQSRPVVATISDLTGHQGSADHQLATTGPSEMPPLSPPPSTSEEDTPTRLPRSLWSYSHHTDPWPMSLMSHLGSR